MRRSGPATSRPWWACMPLGGASWTRLGTMAFIALLLASNLLFLMHLHRESSSASPDSQHMAAVRRQNTQAHPHAALDDADHSVAAFAESPCSAIPLACADNAVAVAVWAFNGTARKPRVCLGGVEVPLDERTGRGMNAITLSEVTGEVMSVHRFDTYQMAGTGFLSWAESINDGRVVVLATHDDAYFKLGPEGRRAAFLLGSSRIDDLNFRGMWTMIGQKGMSVSTLYEEVSLGRHDNPDGSHNWGDTVSTAACVPLNAARPLVVADRARLCQLYEGYGSFCRLAQRHALVVPPPQLPDALGEPSLSRATDFPIGLIAGNRPNYLHRCLTALLALPGVNPARILVLVDGLFPEPFEVARAFGVRAIRRFKTHSTSNMAETFRNADMIALHYYQSLSKLMDTFPDHNHAIVIEEDLEVAPDLLRYFSQTSLILDSDPTLFCVSAWNDNAYEYAAGDPALVYRTGFFPGLGWLLTRSLWAEIEPKWPRCCQGWSWDLWLRDKRNTADRECLMPDMPRTFHFGRHGLNVNNDYFYNAYFKRHALNRDAHARLHDPSRLLLAPYEEDVEALLARAVLLDHSPALVCRDLDHWVPASAVPALAFHSSPPPLATRPVYVAYYAQSTPSDEKPLIKLLACLRLWDLGARGLHMGLIRLHVNGASVLLVGAKSTYAQKHMPANCTPVDVSRTLPPQRV